MSNKVTPYDVISVYRGWLGSAFHQTIIDIYNAHKPLAVGHVMSMWDAWCDATLSAAFIKLDAVDLIGGTECGVERHIELFKKAGIWIEDGSITPQMGDVITFNWDDKTQPNDGFADHIGVVEYVKDGNIHTLEGNTGAGVVGECTYKVGDGQIRGYARPKYDMAKEPENTILVADVSEHQGTIDWDKFAKTIKAVIIRAYNGSREDYQWKRNVAEAERLKVPYGVYMFSKAQSVEQSKVENAAFLKLLEGHKPSYPVYLDRENTKDTNYGTHAKEVAGQFYTDITKVGYVAGLYTGWNFYNTYMSGAKTDSLWLAAYGKNDGTVPYGYKPTVALDGWQYTSVAVVDGISANTVDLSLFYKQYAITYKDTSIHYRAHVQTFGWMDAKKDGEWVGTIGLAKRMEAIKITPPDGVELEVIAHVQTYGDMPYTGIKRGKNSGTGSSKNDPIIGTTGQCKRLEAITIRCTKNNTGKKLKYQGHVQTYGDTDICSEGELCGTTGQKKRLEAIRIWFE